MRRLELVCYVISEVLLGFFFVGFYRSVIDRLDGAVVSCKVWTFFCPVISSLYTM